MINVRNLCLSIATFSLITGYVKIADFNQENLHQTVTSTELTISAASSLQNVLDELRVLYKEHNPKIKIIYNFAASGTLQRQIQQGAPIDIFISAAISHMNRLEQQGLLLNDTRHNLLKNQMVLIVPESKPKNKPKLDNIKGLTTSKLDAIALGEPTSVPAGKYAQEVLNSFRIADRVNSQAVYGKDVRQVLNYVATGNADAGLVYHTDAMTSDRVEVIAIAPEHTHSPIIYPMAVLKDSHNAAAAKELIEFFLSPQAQTLFKQYGFLPTNNN